MSRAAYDVVAVGNAIVDVLAQVDYAFIENHGLVPASMTLIDEARAVELTDLFPNRVIAPGGSAANSMTGIASFGGRAGYMGKVADDTLGWDFTRAFRAEGVHFETPPRKGQPATARCLIAVTPDGQRAMNTFLGASTLLDAHDVDKALVESATVLFLEGYLFDRDEAKAAFVHASEIAKAAGRKVSVTLSDVFCVERHRESFRHLVEHHIDILFANENEIVALYQTPDFETAVAAAREVCPVVAVTRSEKGSVIAAGSETIIVKPEPVARVVDTTGAGDQYAAGFLFGYATGRELAECGRLGSVAAAEVISHMGPRPETSLKALARI
jgi:sugar/nucleoside kinase (ribokinase family)